MKKIFNLLLFIALSICIAFSLDSASPKKGEGIHTFLKRNNRTGSEYYQKFIDLNKNKLGKNKSLKLGVVYLLPPLKEADSVQATQQTQQVQQTTLRTGIEPLFGENLAKYEVESDRLKGACFFLVSGHGGTDPGAVTKIGNVELHEDEYAYDIMLRLALNLLKEGATVHIIIQDAKDGIRDGEYLSNSDRETYMGEAIHQGYTKNDQALRLKQQCNKINNLSQNSNAKYQRAIFIHLDSRPKKQSVDIFFYHKENSYKGKQLATTLRETIRERYKAVRPDRKEYKGTVTYRNLYVLRNTTPVSVYVELGNLQHEGQDRKRFLDSVNRQAIANWLCKGLIKDYNNNR